MTNDAAELHYIEFFTEAGDCFAWAMTFQVGCGFAGCQSETERKPHENNETTTA